MPGRYASSPATLPFIAKTLDMTLSMVNDANAQAGKGSFASRPLAAGEVLWRELPLLSLQVGTIREGYTPGMAQVGVIV